jgi:putative DNA primase/helicase
MLNNNFDSYSDFEKSFEHLYLNQNKKTIKFTTLYKMSEYKNVYSSFDFEPNKKILDDKYNLFKGFIYEDGTEEYNEEVVNNFIEHVKFLCRDDEKVKNYVISWFAHLIQKPEIKTKVALVFYSFEEGLGKNILFDIVAKLLKGYCGKFKDTKAITDRFNGDMFGKLFIVGDEINAKAQEVANELKDIITRITETIEFKNKDKMHNIPDYKNYVFTTNNENVFKISNSDRRFLLVECPDEKKDERYYNTLFNILDNDIKLKSIYNYLKKYDIKNFNIREIPKTEYKKNIIFQNLPAYYKFIKDNVCNYEGQIIKAYELYKNSLDYAKQNKMISSYSEKLFYVNFKKVFGEYNVIKNKISYYDFPEDLGLNIDEIIIKNYVDK